MLEKKVGCMRRSRARAMARRGVQAARFRNRRGCRIPVVAGGNHPAFPCLAKALMAACLLACPFEGSCLRPCPDCTELADNSEHKFVHAMCTENRRSIGLPFPCLLACPCLLAYPCLLPCPFEGACLLACPFEGCPCPDGESACKTTR